MGQYSFRFYFASWHKCFCERSTKLVSNITICGSKLILRRNKLDLNGKFSYKELKCEQLQMHRGLQFLKTLFINSGHGCRLANGTIQESKDTVSFSKMQNLLQLQ